MSTEVFKDILGYEGRYQVSNFGRVKSLKRWQVTRDKILKPRINNKGYHQVNLSKDKKAKNITVHSLVAHAFIGERPDGLTINHIDGNKDNNRASNLEYVTQSRNTQHAYDTGLNGRGESHGRAKLTRAEVLGIRSRYATGGTTQKELAKEFGVSQPIISFVINQKTWSHITKGDES